MPKLYVVATPIGNLSDASQRMLDTLRAVDLIAAEDTRVTGNLCRLFGIAKPLTSLHRHNEMEKTDGLIARMLSEDLTVALVTDAGTPTISDPGFLFVRAVALAGIEVLAIPGPTALAAAISVSGFDAREFAFYGFLPRERGPLCKKLLSIAKGPRVAVVHESGHRVLDLMEAVASTLPGCQAAVCCDLTKLYEKTLRGPAGEVLDTMRANPKVEKGEYCVVLDFSTLTLPEENEEASAALRPETQLVELILSGVSTQDAIDQVVARGARRNEVKRASLRVKRWLATE